MNDDRGIKIPKQKQNEAVGKVLAPSGAPLSSLPSSFNIMYRGYFPLWRKIVDWGWYKDSNTKAVFLHLLLTANHKDTDFLGHKVKEGQCVHGIIGLSKALGLSYQSTRTSIKHLKNTKEITIQATNKFTIYTLINYFKYTPNQYQANKQLTSHQQSTNNQLTTSNNDKNIKNDNKEKYNIYGDKVKLTQKEHTALISKFGEKEAGEKIESLDLYICSKGDKYKSHYKTILMWENKDKKSKKGTGWKQP